jgi:ATP-dependent Clp protease ATP-binding subunit ClpA
MFERFTHGAREVVVRAQEEARALRHGWIGTEHLLLGLLDGGEGRRLLAGLGVEREAARRRVEELTAGQGLDAGALAAMGIDLDAIRARAEAAFGPGALDRPPSRRCRRGRRGEAMPFSAGAKRSLELALREAVALGDPHIGAEHVLLGLVREGEGPAARVLREAGVTRDAIAAAIAQRRRAA